MRRSTQTLTVGSIGAPHGVKGWVRINSYTDNAAAIFDFSPWVIAVAGVSKEYRVASWRQQAQRVIAKLVGIESREQAELLKNAEVLALEAQLPELQAGDFYWRDLVGLQVVNETGYDMGVVDHMLETGANDVMVVKANLNDAFGSKQRMIPYLYQRVIKRVDLAQGIITVAWDASF